MSLRFEKDVDYQKFIDLKPEELEKEISETKNIIKDIEIKIVNNIELASPFLQQAKILREERKKLNEKLNVLTTFLSLERNGSLISDIDLLELKNNLQVPPNTPHPIQQEVQQQSVVQSTKQSTSKFKSQVVENWINKSSKNKNNSKKK